MLSSPGPGADPFTDLHDLFGDLFGALLGGGRRRGARADAPKRGDDLLYSLDISLEEAVEGTEVVSLGTEETE